MNYEQAKYTVDHKIEVYCCVDTSNEDDVTSFCIEKFVPISVEKYGSDSYIFNVLHSSDLFRTDCCFSEVDQAIIYFCENKIRFYRNLVDKHITAFTNYKMGKFKYNFLVDRG